jgi:tetratricopeptide (TPR) repeat protein
MTRTRLGLGAAAACATALVLLLGGVFARSPSAPGGAGTAPVGRASSDRAVSGFSATGEGTASQVARLESAVAADPTNARSFALLGLAYGQRWRETGDASFVTLQAHALRKAERLDPESPLTVEGLGSLALTRHEFGRALQLGRRATRLAPYTAGAYGILGDAQIELGRYGQAFRSFQRMIDLKPSLSSYARVSYARELTGDLDGSIAAMRLALDAAAGDREGYAWTAVQLGKLYWLRGDAGTAAQLYRDALTVFPGYVYALDALAPVEAGRGRLERAIVLERQAVDSIPLPQFVAQLGDLYARAGRPTQARAQYATVRAIQRLLAANGIKSDLETAQFRADHGIEPVRTVALARRARALRPSILGDDTLSWALARAGRCQEALAWSRRALRLGTQDWLLYFHRGEIERCLGDGAEAQGWFRKAVALNPQYSVRWSSQARKGARP